MIEVKGLRKSYNGPNGPIAVLSDVDFVVGSGESVAVVGPSGSGKSTLLALLAGLDVPDAGAISVDGRVVSNASEEQKIDLRQRTVSIVFQRFHLMQSLTAIENVQLALEIQGRSDALSEAERWITAVGLDHRAQHFPRHLSGGECQRVAIARALATQPKVLLADEPSGNLDQATGTLVMDLLYKLTREHGRSLVLVTHNKEHANQCDRQLYLDQGRLVSL